MTEKELLELKLCELDERFPNRKRLTIKDVADYVPCAHKTAKKMFKKGERYISKVTLANKLN